jgi:pyrroline-5-carboxylate reductase
MTNQVVLAGAGNMGFAMLQGWIDGKVLAAHNVFVVEPNAELRSRATNLGAHAVASVTDLPAGFTPHLVVLAVKPQVMGVVLEGYKNIAANGAAFLSVAAGINAETIRRALEDDTETVRRVRGNGTEIVRCMPNTPSSIGKGMLVYFNNASVTADLETFVVSLLSCSGLVAKIDNEALMDAVTAVSGSGPAYVFHFIECLTQAGIDAGLPENIAGQLAMQTIMGAGALAAASADTPTKLREQVTSPNGTTQAALNVLMGGGRMQALISEAVEAARARSVELGK